MKFLLIVLLVLSVAYCANINKLCKDTERNVYCPFIYQPVCAIQKTLTGWKRVTKSNRCVACSEPATDFIALGTCNSYPKDAAFCDPRKSQGWMCNLMINPVCGHYDETFQCLVPPCAGNFSNACIACTNEKVTYVLPGNC